jgi:multidrug efflux pump subunit AcrA (membrane-fusion protein)
MISKRSKFFIILSVVLFLAAGFCFFTNLSQGKESKVEKASSGYVDETHIRLSEDMKNNIKTFDFSETEFPNQIDSMGRISITEDRTSVISSRVSGRVESVLVNSGETIQKGQVVARIFSPDFAATREEYLQAIKQSGPDFKIKIAWPE